jgi:hypothetical protein
MPSCWFHKKINHRDIKSDIIECYHWVIEIKLDSKQDNIKIGKINRGIQEEPAWVGERQTPVSDGDRVKNKASHRTLTCQ